VKTIFFGSPEFALSSFWACKDHSQLLAVVTQPDRPRGRGLKVSPCPLREEALKCDIPTFAPPSLRRDSAELQDLLKFIDQKKPDVFVVTAYGNILPEAFLNIPPRGSVNVHASLLPRWRGAAPIQRSLEAGDTQTGVCLQQMVYELDAGAILLEEACPIDPNENALSLSARLSKMGGTLLERYLMGAPCTGRIQDPSLVTYAPKIEKIEGYWQRSWSAKETHNRVRAFAAWPQVKARVGSAGPEIKILQTQNFAQAKVPDETPRPGKILLDSGKAYLSCTIRAGEPASTSWIELLQVQAAGKKPVNAYEFFKNLSLPSGDALSLEGL
jgi:methionyl-tRNA formyltransferase